MKFTTLAHKIEALFNNMSEQLLNLLICQFQRKFLSWLTETHLIVNYDLQDLDQLSQFYEQLNQSYYDVTSDIIWCERHCQWINQKAFILSVTSLCAAKSLKPIQHETPHCGLPWAAVSMHLDKCWKCDEPGHFSKDCMKPQTNKSAQIKWIEFWLDNQLFCQDFKAQYFSSNNNNDFLKDDLNSSKNLYVS